MHHLLFIRLLNEKTESAYLQVYDAYATRLYAFILPLVENKAEAEDIIRHTFSEVWDEPPVLNLQHPDPFLFLLQKAMSHLLSRQATEQTRQQVIKRTKDLRRETRLTVVTPQAAQGSTYGDMRPRPSA